jgi:hypothetical protein
MRLASVLARGLIATVVSVICPAVEIGTGTGIVKEHCLNTGASQAAQAVRIHSHWTYVLWPPLNLSALDPSGQCVRNSPLREALNTTNIWKLPVAEEQVCQHVLRQYRDRAPS